MSRNWVNKATPSITFAAFSSVLVLGSAGKSGATAAPLPDMTIEIHNSSCQPVCQSGEIPYNIYPVLSTGTALVDEYMQAALGVPADKRGLKPFPKTSQFRIYLTPTGDGIPPGGFVRLTVPAYSQYAATVVPTDPNQYASWWGGGRVDIFDEPNAKHAPPQALTANYTGSDTDRADQTEVTFVTGTSLPSLSQCTKNGVCTPQKLKFFIDPVGLSSHEPIQTTEYTLGALIKTTDPWGINPLNVDYDISYVNDAYLPVAMEPHNNDKVGYIGSITPIGSFEASLNKFLTNYTGWPQYIDVSLGKNPPTIMKVPSPVSLMPYYTAPNPPTDVTGVTGWPKTNWPPIKKLKKQWDTCTDPNATDAICPDIKKVAALFTANYVDCYGSGTPTQDQMTAQAYQWSPFNANCTVHPGLGDINYHLLQNTTGYYTDVPGKTCDRLTGNNCDYTGYQKVKGRFDALQYWPGLPNAPNGQFDPWVVLVHGKDYLDSQAYAYSVDDAIGNMQVPGDGLIIAVGGAVGLPNPDPASPPIQVGYGYGAKDRVQFTKYGACTTTPDTAIDPTSPAFTIYSVENCPLSFIDNLNNLYYFTIKTPPPYPALPASLTPAPANYAPIDCSDNAPKSVGAAWCHTVLPGNVLSGVFAHSILGVGGANTDTNYVIAPAPNQAIQ